MRLQGITNYQSKKAKILTILLSYGFLLLLSYGFPVTGDDWFFTPSDTSSATILEPFRWGLQVAKKHYFTTNGRLLGNFLVAFTGYSKLLRELIRCGIILLVIWTGWQLTGCKGPVSYLLLFALCIAIPDAVASQTYAWAAGFFNYVPPVLGCFLYFKLLKDLNGEGKARSGAVWSLCYALLGFATQLFMENITVCLCMLSAIMLLLDWKKNKRLNPVLAAHFLGTVLGTTVMFLAPGYHSASSAGYREISHSVSGFFRQAGENFKLLSWYLLSNNKMIILPISGACLLLWRRYLQTQGKQTSGRRDPAWLWVILLIACPMFSHGMHMIGNYYFSVDLLGTLLYFLALFMTIRNCVEKPADRFILYLLLGVFVLFISPLMLVSPVGARNAYLFQILWVLVLMILLRLAAATLTERRILPLAAVVVSCMLLLGNFWIYNRNGKCEQLRIRVVEEAMARGDPTITLPAYPYPSYVHAVNSKAIQEFYYYETPGDITFYLITYKEWVTLHPNE